MCLIYEYRLYTKQICPGEEGISTFIVDDDRKFLDRKETRNTKSISMSWSPEVAIGSPPVYWVLSG